MKLGIHHLDALEGLRRLARGRRAVKLVFADPPYNIGYRYDDYRDALPDDQYLAWCGSWFDAVARLQPSSFWLAHCDEYIARLLVRLTDPPQLGMAAPTWSLRNWIIWHYGFGQHLETKFGRNKTHLLYLRGPRAAVGDFHPPRQPSLRQSQYNDRRANPEGRVPGDVWVWPRVCGTHRERVRDFPCQLPEALLERILLSCTAPGDLVVDPFSGSGTTAVVARRLGRRFIGFEQSARYVELSRARLAAAPRAVGPLHAWPWSGDPSPEGSES